MINYNTAWSFGIKNTYQQRADYISSNSYAIYIFLHISRSFKKCNFYNIPEHNVSSCFLASERSSLITAKGQRFENSTVSPFTLVYDKCHIFPRRAFMRASKLLSCTGTRGRKLLNMRSMRGGKFIGSVVSVQDTRTPL